MRELDERLRFGELIERHLSDARGKNTQLPLADLVRQSVYSRLAGYEDVNDAERLPRTRPPADRLRESLGARSSVDLALTVLRNRTADTRENLPAWPRSTGSWSARAKPSIHPGG